MPDDSMRIAHGLTTGDTRKDAVSLSDDYKNGWNDFIQGVEECRLEDTPLEYQRGWKDARFAGMTTFAPPNTTEGGEPRKEKGINPKDIVGSIKTSIMCVPLRVLIGIALGMMEGSFKYGRHNYRATPVRASVYIDAAIRHIFSWVEGEDIDPDTKEAKLHHIDKALASLVVLRDAMLMDSWVDDRPPAHKLGWMDEANTKAKLLCTMYPQPVAPFTQEGMNQITGDLK